MSISAGPRSGSSFASNLGSGGAIPWDYPENAASSDNFRATATAYGNEVTEYLLAANFGFTDAHIPVGSTINGILIEWERSKNDISASVSDHRSRIIKGGTVQAAERAVTGQWPTTDSYQGYGGSTDLWGTTWTDADIKSTGFGAALSANVAGWRVEEDIYPAIAYIDHVRITVYYTPLAAAHILSSQFFNFLLALIAPLAHWLGFWKVTREAGLAEWVRA